MTRVNVVPVESLHRAHLIAEWREIPRIFALAHKASQSSKPWTHKQPDTYKMGTSHVIFFYDKLGYLAERHQQITTEMLARGYKPSYNGSLREEWQGRIPQGYWKDYVVTEEAVAINTARINERLENMK